jgi:hypothetical protein
MPVQCTLRNACFARPWQVFFFSYVIEGNPVAFACRQPEIAPAKAESCWH